MIKEDYLALFQYFRSSDQSLVNQASQVLMGYYSNPESLIFLTSIYLEFLSDPFIKKNVIIGLDCAENNENLSRLQESGQLSIFQNNLIKIFKKETDNVFLGEIEKLLFPVLNFLQASWPELDQYINDGDSNPEHYFFVFNHIVTRTKTPSEISQIIEFARPRINSVFSQINSSLVDAYLSTFCFIATVSVRFEQTDFLIEYAKIFHNFFHYIFEISNFERLEGFFQIVCYCCKQVGEFLEQVCPILDLLNLSLDPNLPYTACIIIREQINKHLQLIQYDTETSIQILNLLIRLSSKLYSAEVDVQTQQIDDYTYMFKKFRVTQCSDICIGNIQQLLQKNQLAAICTALSLYRGAILRGAIFENVVDQFLNFFCIDIAEVKLIALSALNDVIDEISSEIPANSDKILALFSHYLLALLANCNPTHRENISMPVFDIINRVIFYTQKISDETCEILIKLFFSYSQEGSLTENHYLFFVLTQMIQGIPSMAVKPEIYQLAMLPLSSYDPEIRSFSYTILSIYALCYPQVINQYLDPEKPNNLFDLISHENDPNCFGTICQLIGFCALSFRNEMKEIASSKINSILGLINNSTEIAVKSRGSATESLFLFMSAYPDMIFHLLPQALQAVSIILSNEEIDNYSDIIRGIKSFFGVQTEFDSTLFSNILCLIMNTLQKEEAFSETNVFCFDILCELMSVTSIQNSRAYFFYASKMLCDAVLTTFERKEYNNIQAASNFIRNVIIEEENPDPIDDIVKQISDFAIQQLAHRQHNADINSQLLLILAEIVLYYPDCVSEDLSPIIFEYIVETIRYSIPNTAKSAAYCIKNLALSPKIDIINANIQQIYTILTGRLSPPDCCINPLLILNDNIISTLIAIEKKCQFMPIDNFYATIDPFLPCLNDTNELSDIYDFLLDMFPQLNGGNKERLAQVMIMLLSQKGFIQLYNNFFSDNSLHLILSIVKNRLESLENPKDYLVILMKDDEHIIDFTNNMNISIAMVMNDSQSF